jgi:hypothetical protein
VSKFNCSPRSPRPQSGLYPADTRPGEKVLFVPTEDMLLVHEASTQSAVARRAGVDGETLRRWKIAYGEQFLRRLYGAKVDAEAQQPASPTALMLAFRKESSISAVRAAAVRTLADIPATQAARYNPEVSHRLINLWRKEYRTQPWFDGWLLRGEAPPGHVTVASAQQVRRCRSAWDFHGLCRRAEPPISAENTYITEWLGNDRIPDVQWLLWLYGAPPPEGAFVVNIGLQSLRSEMTDYRVCVAAGIHWKYPSQWRGDDALGPALEDALRTASPSGKGREAWRRRWGALRQAAAERIWEFARCATLPACCGRAGILNTDYYQALAEARACGVGELLRQYLTCEGPFSEWNYREVGLVAADFFIASPLMVAFRRVAAKEMHRQAIWGLADLPGFLDWFRDWATPGQRYGRRKELPFTSGGNSATATKIMPAASKDCGSSKDNREEVKQPPHPVWVDQPRQHPIPVASVGTEPTEPYRPNSAPSGARPRWDAERRTLYYGDQACKVFRQKPGHQETILQTFEDDGWPARIDDPLPGGSTADPGQRLRNAIRNLNDNQRPQSLRFRCDGREGVLWEPVT